MKKRVSSHESKQKRRLAARLSRALFFFSLWVHCVGRTWSIKCPPRRARETRAHIFSCRQILTACNHIYSQFFFLQAKIFFLSPNNLNLLSILSLRVDSDVNSFLGLVTNGKLSSPSLPSCFFFYDEQRCRPYHTKPWWLHCPSQTDELIFTPIIAFVYDCIVKNLRLTSSRYLGSPFLQFYKTDKNLGLSPRNFPRLRESLSSSIHTQ